jgi:predicted nucleic acid-binding protein
MNGKEILVDTNIILYLLDGSDELEKFLQGKDLYISFITELELLGYKNISQKQEQQIADILGDCSIISMSNLVKEKYIEVKRKYQLKLPDAIIAASAIAFDMPLITSDKQFKTISELVDASKLITYLHSAKLTDPKKDQ